MALTRLLLLAATAYVAVKAQGATCDFDKLQSCQDQFNDDLGFSEPKPWQDSVAYRTKVEDLYLKTGQNGVRKVCRFFRKFKECLGGCYQKTVNVPFIVKNAGVSPAETTTYLATLSSMHYLCGAGFGTYIANPSCFISSWTSSRASLDSARNTFDAQSYLFPAQACSLANNVLTTFERAFSSGCGVDARDTQFWGCEYARTGIFTANPQCALSCSLPIVGN